jgi:hypothetical protein
MTWYKWIWWRFAWGLNWGGECKDCHGRWKAFGYLNILVERRVSYPVGEPNLYKQVYHELRNRGFSHDECVDIAADALEAYGSHRALSHNQLNDIIEEVS